MKRRNGMAGSGRRGAALIITLAFMVLLATVMIIFFTQALSYRQQSNSNFNDFKSATLAQSALETVVGDLRQEIVNGSTNYTYGSGTTTSYLSMPTNNLFAVPQRSGTNYVGGVDTTPNLIRISIRSDGIAYPGVGSRASAVSSTNVASSGQYISLARWNKHYLLPRGTSSAGVYLPGTTIIDTTPTNTFNPPDWVYVTSQGPQVLTTPTSAVIGRYAYAIYDEGGLLDANVVGVPSNMATNTAPDPVAGTTWPVWGSGLKGSEAFADLTVTNAITQAPMFAQTNINEIVGWRDNATAQPSGNFTNGYTFSAAQTATYHDAMVNNTNGFLVTSGNSYTDPTSGKIDTDQAFTSRQSLINFAITAGLPQDSLQYLATFTRDTEQPCYNPPVGRPMVQSSAMANAASFGTGNDAYHVDRVTTTPTTNAPSDINPPFLNVRVTTSFVRADGTTAQVGDPLIKERFPLSRLSLFPSGGVAPGAAAAALIYKYFGLTYQAESGSTPAIWLYNHDLNNTTGIDRLSPTAASPTIGVTVQAREPDFFELLKAAINVGSIGKAAAYNESNNGSDNYTTGGSVGNLLQNHDTVTGLQILQIGANIIDQTKADNFPTRIQFSGDPAVPPNVVCGSEDLPYLYRMRNWISQYSATQVAYLIQPELWDPYSYNAAASSGLGSSGFVTAANTPKNFRIRLEPDPTLSANATPINFVVTYKNSDTTTQSNVSLNFPNYKSTASGTPNPAPLTFNAGELNSYWGFREPTLLSQPSIPSTANLNVGNPYSPPNYTDVNNHANLTGFLITTFPWVSPTGGASDTGNKVSVTPSSEPSCLRAYLEYQDAANNWVVYDQQELQYQGGASGTDIHVIQNASNNTYAKCLASNNYDDCGWVRTDPRTCRWGAMYTEYFNYIPTLNLSYSEFATERPDGGLSDASHLGGKADLGFKVWANGYQTGVTYASHGDQHGYYAENSVRITYQSDSPDSGQRFYCDPDGIPRRGMAGYVSDPADNGAIPSTYYPEGSSDAPLAPNYSGLPFYTADNITPGVSGQGWSSRPTILHRPFRSVAELGYVFRDTPWGNINFSFPESGDSPLLDVFCINDTSSTGGLVAGRVNLNTRQAPVIAALLSGTLLDKDNSAAPTLSQSMASDIAKALVSRTTSSTIQGPLMSRADLVGIWTGGASSTTAATTLASLQTHITDSGVVNAIDPNNFFTGFSRDVGSTNIVTGVNTSVTGTAVALITRQRDSALRALVNCGTSRTWNVLIDLVAQGGRFPPTAVAAGAAGLPQFVVEGEKHYWLHVAIDRYTGKVIDSQLEVVRE